MLSLDSHISQLSPIAQKLTAQLKKIKIETVRDLIFYYPFRYDDFSKILTVSGLKAGIVASVMVKVDLIQTKRSFKRKLITEAIVSDRTGSIKATWFNQPYIGKILKIGDEIFLAGRVDDHFGLQFTSPNYEKVKSFTTHTARLVPVYSVTNNLTSKQIRYLVRLAYPLIKKLPEHLPWQIKRELNLLDLSKACQQIHFPTSNLEIEKARQRLKFDELFIVQLGIKFLKNSLAKIKAKDLLFQEEIIKNFVDGLSFKLTNDQRKTAWQILNDLKRAQPMNRLLEGEVGSGKTVVAVIAMINTFANGCQVVFMVPTEILASQHYKSIGKLLRSQKIRISLLTRSQSFLNQKKITKKKMLQKIKSGEIDIVIGTHALIAEKVAFKNLALAVIDEQHRFGVNQRRLLKEKSGKGNFMPHLLSMTATPIPRTLALVFYGDLDISIIRELPKGRKKIITKVVQPADRIKAYQFIKEQIKERRQAFIICPLIDPSDKLEVKSVKEEYQRLTRDIFPELKISFLHGRMKAAEKEKIMSEFLANKINILVSTSVVEVGIDVANATVMIVEDAERFGLAQLHQFRGRVGRSNHQSYCFLFTKVENLTSITRLQALVKSEDGFSLAEKDLEFRGQGEIYGVRQSGMADYFKIANLFDYQTINSAKDQAEKILKIDPDLKNFPLLLEKIGNFQKSIHLE